MEKRHIEKWWYCFFSCVFQISSWVCVIAVVIYNTFPENEVIKSSYYDEEERYTVIIRTSLGNFCYAYFFIGPISYAIYLALEFCSVTYKYLERF